MPTQAEVISAARQILGNKDTVVVGEQKVPDEAVALGMAPYVRRLNKQFGNAAGRKEAFFDAVPNQQDYLLSTVLGNDVSSVEEVVRSAEGLAADAFGPVEIDARDGTPLASGGVIPYGGQSDAMETILAQARYRRAEQFSWKIAYPAAGKSIRLMPCPTAVEKVYVSYVTTAGSIETLPDEAADALNYAACVAMLDAMINRINSERPKSAVGPVGDARDTQVKVLMQQRERYEALYQGELAGLGT